MQRLMSTALALLLFTFGVSGGALTAAEGHSDEALGSGVKRLERAEYAEALADFARALDSYAAAGRLDDARRAYMQMFVGNRTHANFLMKAMKSWVGEHRGDAAGLPREAFAAFDAWVHERDALAAATIDLVHNLPDWK